MDINFSFAERDQSDVTQTQPGLEDTEDPDATSARSSLMTDEQLVTHAMPASASMVPSSCSSSTQQTLTLIVTTVHEHARLPPTANRYQEAQIWPAACSPYSHEKPGASGAHVTTHSSTRSHRAWSRRPTEYARTPACCQCKQWEQGK